MKRIVFMTLLLVLSVSLVACGGDSDPTPLPRATTDTSDPTPTREEPSSQTAEYRTITIEEFANILETQSDAYTVINVHIPYAGEVEGTDANIDYQDIAALTAALPDKDAPIILYCRSGNMSEQATRALVGLGYTNIYDVPGGMNAWTASGRELIGQ